MNAEYFYSEDVSPADYKIIDMNLYYIISSAICS